MLFGYTCAPVALNWIHDCLIHVVEQVHDLAKKNESLPPWPEVLPLAYRCKLAARTGLKDRIQAYYTAVLGESSAVAEDTFLTARAQNAIAKLLSGESDCKTAEAIPETIRRSAVKLFEYGFSLLSELQIRDQYYEGICANVSVRGVCPFCGIEYMEEPGGRRQTLDHYLAKTIYPYAAANLENLPPMGNDCNSIKIDADILRRPDGSRRRAFYPFAVVSVSVSFLGSVAFQPMMPKWNIDFEREPVYSEEVDTWAEMFGIRDRYVRNVLNPRFAGWIESFSQWAARNLEDGTLDEQAVLHHIDSYCVTLEIQNLRGRDQLQLPVFRWLSSECKNSNQRLVVFLKDTISSARGYGRSL